MWYVPTWGEAHFLTTVTSGLAMGLPDAWKVALFQFLVEALRDIPVALAQCHDLLFSAIRTALAVAIPSV